MASYPTQKKHFPSRRRLGKNQYPASAGITVAVTDSGDVATLTFNRPVVVTGNIPMTVAGGPTFVSQAMVSPTVYTLTYSAALTTHAWSIPAGAPQVSSYQGGSLIGAAGTFS